MEFTFQVEINMESNAGKREMTALPAQGLPGRAVEWEWSNVFTS
jgi:hypothetical protein